MSHTPLKSFRDRYFPLRKKVFVFISKNNILLYVFRISRQHHNIPTMHKVWRHLIPPGWKDFQIAHRSKKLFNCHFYKILFECIFFVLNKLIMDRPNKINIKSIIKYISSDMNMTPLHFLFLWSLMGYI